MPRWLKTIIGVLLLPACAGAAMALWQVLQAGGRADAVWIAALAGAVCWVVVYLLLPRPMWIYVVGHELTHALWTWAMGGRVKKFKATSSGGQVIVTKTNFLIALAPYFFPLYAVLLVILFSLAGLVWNVQPYLVWFHLLLGAAYAFHITLTLHALRQGQTDISSQGRIFSAAVIFLGNALVLLIGVPLVTKQVTVLEALGWWCGSTLAVLAALRRLAPIRT